MPVGKYHTLAVQRVCASYQSKAFYVISELLSDEEKTILKRGRNATGNSIPKSSNTMEYRRATAVECLFGYLYLLGQTDRIQELFDIIWQIPVTI